jgi:hypothetical protein
MKPPWFLSRHALGRMDEMGLSRREVVDVLDRPEASWPSRGRRIAASGDIAVVYAPENRAVVTILWWTLEPWCRAS